MAILISGTTISEAWLSGLEALAERDGVAINLCVAIADPHQEDLGKRVILRLQGQLVNGQKLSSVYEMGVSTGDDEGHELRIQCPGKDTRTIGFPCLSHISLTLEERRLHLTATYRNQFFISRAYGNYLGLSRLLAFLCKETGCVPGEVLAVATHADAEFSAPGIGKRKVLDLISRCRAIFQDGSTWMEDESPKQEQMNGRARSKRQPNTAR